MSAHRILSSLFLRFLLLVLICFSVVNFLLQFPSPFPLLQSLDWFPPLIFPAEGLSVCVPEEGFGEFRIITGWSTDLLKSLVVPIQVRCSFEVLLAVKLMVDLYDHFPWLRVALDAMETLGFLVSFPISCLLCFQRPWFNCFLSLSPFGWLLLPAEGFEDSATLVNWDLAFNGSSPNSVIVDSIGLPVSWAQDGIVASPVSLLYCLLLLSGAMYHILSLFVVHVCIDRCYIPFNCNVLDENELTQVFFFLVWIHKVVDVKRCSCFYWCIDCLFFIWIKYMICCLLSILRSMGGCSTRMLYPQICTACVPSLGRLRYLQCPYSCPLLAGTRGFGLSWVFLNSAVVIRQYLGCEQCLLPVCRHFMSVLWRVSQFAHSLDTGLMCGCSIQDIWRSCPSLVYVEPWINWFCDGCYIVLALRVFLLSSYTMDLNVSLNSFVVIIRVLLLIWPLLFLVWCFCWSFAGIWGNGFQKADWSVVVVRWRCLKTWVPAPGRLLFRSLCDWIVIDPFYYCWCFFLLVWLWYVGSNGAWQACSLSLFIGLILPEFNFMHWVTALEPRWFFKELVGAILAILFRSFWWVGHCLPLTCLHTRFHEWCFNHHGHSMGIRLMCGCSPLSKWLLWLILVEDEPWLSWYLNRYYLDQALRLFPPLWLAYWCLVSCCYYFLYRLLGLCLVGFLVGFVVVLFSCAGACVGLWLTEHLKYWRGQGTVWLLDILCFFSYYCWVVFVVVLQFFGGLTFNICTRVSFLWFCTSFDCGSLIFGCGGLLKHFLVDRGGLSKEFVI